MAGKSSNQSSACAPPPGMAPKKTTSYPKGGYGGKGTAKK